MTKELTKVTIKRSTSSTGEMPWTSTEILKILAREDFSEYTFENMYISENYPGFDYANYGTSWVLNDEDTSITLSFFYN